MTLLNLQLRKQIVADKTRAIDHTYEIRIKMIPMAGYSKRSLTQKLGYKPGYKVLILQAPKHYWELLEDLPEDLVVHQRKGKGPYDLIHLFVYFEKDFLKNIAALQELIDPKGSLWVSWPKGTSAIDTDINRDFIREYLLKHTHLVDCKVAAIDEDWSGLKFMVRKSHR